MLDIFRCDRTARKFAPEIGRSIESERAPPSAADERLAPALEPVVALNRAMALAQLEGPERGLEAVRAIAFAKHLGEYPFCEPGSGYPRGLVPNAIE